jgi:hypothetical protein
VRGLSGVLVTSRAALGARSRETVAVMAAPFRQFKSNRERQLEVLVRELHALTSNLLAQAETEHALNLGLVDTAQLLADALRESQTISDEDAAAIDLIPTMRATAEMPRGASPAAPRSVFEGEDLMATIARLVTVIEAQQVGIDKAVANLEVMGKHAEQTAGTVSTLGKAIAGAFTLGAIAGVAKEIMGFASEMTDMSARTGIGIERLQALTLVAGQSGVTVEEMASAVGQLSKRLIEGDTGAVNALQRLGLHAQALINMDPDLAFIQIAEAVAGIPNPMERSALAMELFGRSGSKFVPLMTTELGNLVDEAQRSGAIIGEDLVKKIDAFDDSLSLAWAHTRGFVVDVVAFASEMSGLSRAFSDVSSLANYVQHGNAMEDVLNRIKSPVKSLATTELPNLTLSMKEADKIAKQLTDDTLKQIEQKQKDHARAVEQAERAYRGYVNFVEERYIESVRLQIEETERMRQEMNRIETAFTDDYLVQLQRRVQATQDAADAQEATWRDYQNQVGLIYMEQDRLAMENTRSMGDTWMDFFGKLGSLFGQAAETFEDIFGPRFASAMRHLQDSMQHGRNMVSGVLRGLSGDFTGWISAVMSGIAMVKSAWQGLKELFGGGEEGVVVNPARDKFLSQWGDPSNKGVGGAGHNLAALLTSLGAGEGGGAIFAALQNAATMALFRPAAMAIVEFLNAKGHDASINFHRGGVVPGTGEVPATLLGGERVQSRDEVADMRGISAKLDQLNYNLMNALEVRPSQLRAFAQIQRGLGASA